MKLNSILKIASLGFCLVAGSVYALPNTVTLRGTAWNGTPDLGGGEFKVETSNNGTFYSFCMEHAIKVELNKSYTYTIDKNVLSGGANLVHTGDVGSGDSVSIGTAWLFGAYVNGTLFDAADASKSYFDANRDYSAGLLQAAFWMLEDEIAVDSSNVYYSYVQTLLAGNAKNGYVGPNVKAVNLWGADRKDIQSVLIFVPEVSSSIALLGLGLVGLAALRRKF